MEYSAFEKVPLKGRSFSFWDQTVFWFSACSLPAAWYYGALMAGWQGMVGALVLIFIVNTVSLLPWAYLGEIASVTGGSSVAIVRPAFGIKGSVVPSVFYLILGFGWAVVNVFLGAIALSFIFKLWLGLPSYLDSGNLLPMIGYIIIVCLIQGVFAVAGHRMIKKVQWIATIFFLILGAYQTVVVFQHWGFHALFAWKPQGMLSASVGPFTYPITFALLVDLLIAYNWTWEFIGDFSRFSKNRAEGTWGPFLGANLAQFWWFFVGALAVVYLSVTTGTYSPLLADPSSTTVTLGLGWLAALVILLATVTTNAANIYASALGVSNMIPGRKTTLTTLLKIVAVTIVPLSLSPLASKDFVGFYMFFLDVLGAIVIPLWTLTLVDYFIVKRRKYTDDLFRKNGGAYWYKNGWNWPAVFVLLLGTGVYWIFGYAFPIIRQTVTAALPTMAFVAALYIFWMNHKKLIVKSEE
jgi:nucleobase:cation symporter-1, NCS1 family